MKVGVLIKQVPDTETKIRVKADKSGIEENDIKFIISPYDEFAIEEAIKAKERAACESVVISLGPDRVVESIRTALAMGIDKAVHIDSQGNKFDSTTTATLLSKVLKAQGIDLIFCGKQAIDEDNGQVAQMIAEMLDIPQVMIIEKFELSNDHTKAKVSRRVGGGTREVYDVSFPAIFGCEKGLNTPRFASLPGIMKAKSKPVEKLSAQELLVSYRKNLVQNAQDFSIRDLSSSSGLGTTETLVQLTNFQLPPERSAGIKIEGEPHEQASKLAKLLREEAKVI